MTNGDYALNLANDRKLLQDDIDIFPHSYVKIGERKNMIEESRRKFVLYERMMEYAEA